MKYAAFAISEAGSKRTENHDAFVVDQNLGFFGVADGVIKQSSPGLAARTALEVIQSVIKDNASALARYTENPSYYNKTRVNFVIEGAFERATDKLRAMGEANTELGGMTAAVAVMLLVGNTAFFAHMGDVRVYVLRSGRLELVTKDHLNAEESDAGEAFTGRRGKLTRAVSPNFPNALPDIIEVELVPGDKVLICTDGLYKSIGVPQRMADTLAFENAAKVPGLLHRKANENDQGDNMTALVVDIDKQNVNSIEEAERKASALKRIALFSLLTPLELLRVLKFMSVKDYKQGERVVAEREVGEEFYISVTGTFNVVKGGQKLAELDKGSFFGEMGLINKQPRTADVYANTAARMLVMKRADFKRLAAFEPHIACKLMWALCQALNERLRATSEDLTFMMQMSEVHAMSDDESEDGVEPQPGEGASGGVEELEAMLTGDPLPPRKKPPAPGGKKSAAEVAEEFGLDDEDEK
jgi:serine/threonine protein phosphatase PrpC/CRP-like cAMP-binding protein